MKHKLLGLLAGTALFSGLGAVVSQPGNAAPHNPNITFECNRATLTTHAKNIATGQYSPPIVNWRSPAFLASGYTPLRRCEEVSGRFRRLHVSDRLDFFTAGIVNGLPVICSVSAIGETCNSGNLLVTLSPGNESFLPQYLQSLAEFSRGSTTAPPIQESGGRTYVPVAGIIAPISGTATTPSESPSVAPETSAPTDGGGFGGW